MRPGDRLICALVEPLGVGRRFQGWPLHVTVIPWFRLGDDTERLAAGLRQAFTGIPPFESAVRGVTRLGPNKDRVAHLLEPALYPELESRARRYLHKKRAWLADETTRTRRPYLPHVTFQGDDHLEGGDSIYCDRVYIVAQEGDTKLVAGEIAL